MGHDGMAPGEHVAVGSVGLHGEQRVVRRGGWTAQRAEQVLAVVELDGRGLRSGVSRLLPRGEEVPPRWQR